jgi:hypothetical protein
MLYVEKTRNIYTLISLLDSILFNEKYDNTLCSNTFTINDISRDLYFLTSHRYIDNKDYLYILEIKISHCIQILIIKPHLQLVFTETTCFNLSQLKKIIQIIRVLVNPISPRLYKNILMRIILLFY